MSPQKQPQDYLWNDVITLNAVPAMGYVFQSWTGDISDIDPTQPSVTFEMLVTRAINANFAASSHRYTVTVDSAPSDGGSITLDPDQTDYLVNQTISVSASANEGYVFAHWSGDLTDTDPTTSLRVDGAKSITAIFYPTLTILQNIPVAGAVDVAPNQPANGYASGTLVTLTAKPAIGYIFNGWTGDVSGIPNLTQSIISITMDTARTIGAEFAGPIAFKVVANADPESTGSVALQPVQPAEGYPASQQVIAYAFPAPGYAFSHWTGDASGTSPAVTISIDAAKEMTAVFNPKVTIECDPPEGGTIEVTPVAPSNAYVPGTSITVTAKPNKGYRFSSWDYDLSGSESSAAATVDGPMTIKAIFFKHTSLPNWLWPLLGFVSLLVLVVPGRLIYRRLTARSGAGPP